MTRSRHALLASFLLFSGFALLPGCAGKPAAPEGTPKAAMATHNQVSSTSAPDVPAPELLPLVGTFKVARYAFDNGLRLLVVENHSSPTFAYQTWFRVGSRDEVPNYTGLAHLFEHMMFKETGRLKDGEFFKTLEGAGAEGTNAFTSNDYTAYVQELPRDKLDLISDLESDRMTDLRVDANAFKTERDVVQNERRFRNENSPDGTMYQELEGTAFTKHPYHWPVIGYAEDLERMSEQDALNFYHAYYAPNHATIIVVGDVTGVEAYREVRKHYATLAAQQVPEHPIEAEPPQENARHKTLKLSIQVEKLLMGYHVPNILSEDMAPLEVLSAVLAGGKSSRLYRALVDTGIANSIDASNGDGKDPSLFTFSANMQKGRKAAQAESVILREIARLSRDGAPERELERARNRLNFAFYNSLDSNGEMARFLGHFESSAGNFDRGIQIHDQIQRVTAADVQKVSRKYLLPSNRTVITGVPK